MTEIVYLNQEQKQHAVDVLASAFERYPVMEYVIGAEDPQYNEKLQKLVGFYSQVRFNRNWPVVGLKDNDEIVAIMLLNEPEEGAWIESDSPELHELRASLGDEAYNRMEQFEKESSNFEPDYPHYFLGMIGVKQGVQGKGYAYRLIQHAIALSEEHPESQAIVLSTESEYNINYYLRQGFDLVDETAVGTFVTRCFVRKT